ncbi:MAG: FAD-dependent oxidoreductase [Dehalococcoidia bacterium]|nr:MAG: FAD-dependent oxidoreductase [Dehalococcoidia bacterium]
MVFVFDNLLMAGRCFSANLPGLHAARNITYCMALGQAAGTAGAQLSAEAMTDVPSIDIRKLQQKLRSVIWGARSSSAQCLNSWILSSAQHDRADG